MWSGGGVSQKALIEGIVKLKLILVAAARPNFMKIAPLARELMKRAGRDSFKIVHTGQHYDPNLSDVFFKELEIPQPDYSLGISTPERDKQIAEVRSAMIPVIRKEAPDFVVVVGDVNSTLGAARAAKDCGVRVAHVEAGLRSFDMEMPEERNRIETDRISDLLYVTEQAGIDNLAAEQVPGEAVLVGNVMIDTLVHALPKLSAEQRLAELGLQPGNYIVSTFHRPSNVDRRESAEALLEKIRLCCSFYPVVLPIHPRTKKSFAELGLLEPLMGIVGLKLIEPAPYFDFLGLVKSAAAVVTDSGGIQEEATYLGIPCLTLRKNTERPSTIEIGTNTLIGDDVELLKLSLAQIKGGAYKKGTPPPLWDGNAAERIIMHLKHSNTKPS